MNPIISLILKKWMLLLPLMLCAQAATAHQISTGYLNIKQVDSDAVSGQIQLRFTDISQELNFNQNNDSHITWGEVKSHHADINSWLKNKLLFNATKGQCSLSDDTVLMIDHHFNDAFLVIDWQYFCDSTAQLQMVYQGLFNITSNHKLIVNGRSQNGDISRVLDGENNTLSIDSNQSNIWQTFYDYTKQGVIHILIGLDHILFLLILLLSTMLLNASPTKNRKSISNIWIEVVKLATVFTLAHSVTLVLTALGWLQFSSRWVEVIIAFTVAFTAFNNVKPMINKVLPLTFVFGLFHGMGFAGVLGELGLPQGVQLIPILSFNLGVELGQIFLILLTLPVLIYVNNKTKYAAMIFKVMSLMVVCLAIVWIFQRI